MLRLFVALTLPQPVRMRLSLLGGGIPGARWIPAENLHLTLRFIGEVDMGRSQDIDDALQSIEAPGFPLILEGVGYFGPARAARSIHIGVRRNPALEHLYQKIESALVRAGCEPERRKFSGHVTLARLRNAPGNRIAGFVAEHNLVREGPIPIGNFTLFSSFLSHNEPIYRVERVYPLGSEPAWPVHDPGTDDVGD